MQIKLVLAGIIGLFIGVSVSVQDADAADAKRAKVKASEQRAVVSRRVYDDRDAGGWYPRDSNQLKFGSRIWWEQMEREGRLSRPERN